MNTRIVLLSLLIGASLLPDAMAQNAGQKVNFAGKVLLDQYLTVALKPKG